MKKKKQNKLIDLSTYAAASRFYSEEKEEED